MGRNGQTLIYWIVGATAFVGTLVLVAFAFQATFPGTFESVIGSGLGIWGTNNLTWNTLSVYGAQDTEISPEYKNIAILSFDKPLADDVVQGGDLPIRVTSPGGITVENGYYGSEYTLSDNIVAFTLSGDFDTGDPVTVEISGTIESESGVIINEGECTDGFADTTEGYIANESRCDVSGSGTDDGENGGGSGGVEGTDVEFTQRPTGRVCAGETYEVVARATDEEGRLAGQTLTIMERIDDPNLGTGEYSTVQSTICSDPESCTVSADWTPPSPVGHDITAEIDLGGGNVHRVHGSYLVESCGGGSSEGSSGGDVDELTIADIEAACTDSGSCTTDTFPWFWLQSSRWGDEFTIPNNDRGVVDRGVGSCDPVEIELVGDDIHLWRETGTRIQVVDGPFDQGETVETDNGDMVLHIRSFSSGDSVTLVPRCGTATYSGSTTVEMDADWIGACQDRYSDSVPADTADFTGDDLLTCADEISADCVDYPGSGVISSDNCEGGTMQSMCSLFGHGSYDWADGCFG